MSEAGPRNEVSASGRADPSAFASGATADKQGEPSDAASPEASPHLLDSEFAQVRAWLRTPGQPVHLMGIGGVGMAALAVHLRARGFPVTGCDAGGGSLVDWLRAQDFPVTLGHHPDHVTADVAWLIRSAAVPETHPEVQAALRAGRPVFRRGVVLPALLDGLCGIAVSGTHGKTTTTAMIAQVLRLCGCNASFAVGGEVDGLGGVAAAGRAPVLVVEADESDGTVAIYEPDYAVVTNAELDHVDHFASADDLCACLSQFCGRARRAAVVCADDPAAVSVGRAAPRRMLFGFAEEADWRAIDVDPAPMGIAFTALGPAGARVRVSLPVPGRHNVLNALAALAVVADFGIAPAAAAAALARFCPARRRFETIAEGQGVRVISDYAHHPTEVAALMTQAVGLGHRRTVAVFQPHRYSRTRMFAEGFAAAFAGVDALVLAPVYSASEPLVPGGRSEDVFPVFARGLGERAQLAVSLDDAWSRLRGLVRAGDLLLVVGAGDVEKLAFRARDELQSGAWPTM